MNFGSVQESKYDRVSSLFLLGRKKNGSQQLHNQVKRIKLFKGSGGGTNWELGIDITHYFPGGNEHT